MVIMMRLVVMMLTMLIPADGSVCVEGDVSMCQVVEQDPEAPRGSR